MLPAGRRASMYFFNQEHPRMQGLGLALPAGIQSERPPPPGRRRESSIFPYTRDVSALKRVGQRSRLVERYPKPGRAGESCSSCGKPSLKVFVSKPDPMNCCRELCQRRGSRSKRQVARWFHAVSCSIHSPSLRRFVLQTAAVDCKRGVGGAFQAFAR